MSLSLSELQKNFSLALHYQAKGEDCNIESDYLSADERMQIYRNNFVIGLSEILSATYPMTQQLVGEETFLQILRDLLKQYAHQNISWQQLENAFETTLKKSDFTEVEQKSFESLHVNKYDTKEWKYENISAKL